MHVTPLVLLSPLENDALHACLKTERTYHDEPQKDFLEKPTSKIEAFLSGCHIPLEFLLLSCTLLKWPHESIIFTLQFLVPQHGIPWVELKCNLRWTSLLHVSRSSHWILLLFPFPGAWWQMARVQQLSQGKSWNTGRLHTVLKITELFFALRLLLWASETVAANAGQVSAMTTKSGHPKLDTGTVMAASVASSSTFKHLHGYSFSIRQMS